MKQEEAGCSVATRPGNAGTGGKHQKTATAIGRVSQGVLGAQRLWYWSRENVVLEQPYGPRRQHHSSQEYAHSEAAVVVMKLTFGKRDLDRLGVNRRGGGGGGETCLGRTKGLVPASFVWCGGVQQVFPREVRHALYGPTG